MNNNGNNANANQNAAPATPVQHNAPPEVPQAPPSVKEEHATAKKGSPVPPPVLNTVRRALVTEFQAV